MARFIGPDYRPSISAGPLWVRAAVDALGADLPAVAAHYALTAPQRESLLLTSSSARLSPWGLLYHHDELPQPATFSDGILPTNPTADGETFQLHSKPDAVAIIWLDFTATTVTTPYWNGGRPITVPAYSLDADPAYSAADLAAIRQIWLGVAEDYLPFNVDVTTERPTGPTMTKFIRVTFSSNSAWYGAAGGVCYSDSFSWGMSSMDSQMCWVFSTLLGNNTKAVADAASHEAGHALGLYHWSTWDAAGNYVNEYYPGYGAGSTGWAPLMGNSYGKALSQWSKGEYPYANTGINTRQDDVSKIASVVGYRTDDAGASSSQAPLLRGTVSSGLALVDTRGVISSGADTDLHTIDTTGGALSLEVRPAAVNGNVDFQARPLGRGTATLTATLAAGTYFVKIKPIGYVDPATSLGYSTYGSLGAYQVIGSFPGTTLAAPIITPPPPAVDSTPPTAAITAPTAGTSVKNRTTVTITAAGADALGLASIAIYANNTAVCSVSVVTSTSVSCAYKPTKAGTVTLTARATDRAGNVGTSAPVALTVTR